MSQRSSAWHVVVLVALALFAARGSAAAHSMDFALRGSGDVRIVFRYAAGAPMSDAGYRVFAPGNSVDPIATGSTDSAGEAGFRATSDGQWRIEASDSTGQVVKARIDVSDGVPSLARHRIPDWLATVSLSLNVLIAVGYGLARRARGVRRGAAPSRAKPPRPATSRLS